MLRCYHGASASTSGRLLSQSQHIAMSSLSGTTNLAADAMRSMATATAAVRARAPSAMATQRAQSIDRLWSPAHGIIFSRGETAVATSNSRALSTSSLSTFEKPTAAIEETYILSNAENSNSSISQPSEKPSSSPPSSGDSSWLPPSNISARSLQVEPLQPESSQAELQEAKTRISEVLENQKEDGEDAETHIPLSFAIPPDIFAAAKAAEPGTADSFWTHKLYTGPDAAKVKVHYCKSRHTTEAVLQKHFLNKPILGFDIEWKMDSSRYASAKKNVSLIQIACEDRIILSHLALFPRDTLQELVAPTLKRIMEDENVTKCGVAIKADCTRLRKFLNIDVKGIFELSHLHRLIKYSDSGEYGLINKKLVSLTAQAEEHLELPIFKGEVRGSDWSEPLNMEQILYAASDSYAGFILYDVLESKRKALRPTPPRPYHAELNKPIRLASGISITVPIEDTDEAEPRKTSVAAAAQAVVDLDVALEDAADSSASPKSKKGKKEKTDKVVKLVDPRVEDAAAFAAAYRAAHPSTAATPAALRAYYIWSRNPGLSVGQIAGLLREPPLQVGTVANYILEAMRLEGRGVVGSVAWLVEAGGRGEEGEVARGLDVDRGRLRGVLEGLRGNTREAWRWKGLWKAVGGEKVGAKDKTRE